MRTMRQLQFLEPNSFEWQEVASPRIANGKQAIIKPLAVARCDLDLYIANGAYPMKGPFGFGHEIAGEVVEIGDRVRSVAPGHKVIVPFQINCGACGMCRRGFTNACESVPPFSAYGLAPSSGKDWGGGLSDCVLVPFADAMLVPIPLGVSLPAAAVLSDNASDGYRVISDALRNNPEGDILVVGGLGQSVGLFAVAYGKALKARSVSYTDFANERLKVAADLGAMVRNVDYKSAELDKQYEIVIDASATSDGLVYALRSTKACGECISISNPVDGHVELPLREMYMKGASWNISRVHARGALENALACVSCGDMDPTKIISNIAKFEDAPNLLPMNSIKPLFLRD